MSKFEDFEEMENTIESIDEITLNGNTDYIIQPYFDHSFDFRVQLVGDHIAGVEQRSGREDVFQTNLSQMEGSKSERAIRGLREGNIRVLGVDRSRSNRRIENNPNSLPRQIQNLGEDTIYALEEFTNGQDNLFVGADYMMVDRENLENIPDDHLSDRYAVDGKYIFTTELNDGGGDIIDRANLMSNLGHNMPVLHLAHLLGDIADTPIQEPFDMSGNLESKVWRRTGMVYDNMWPSEIMALRNREESYFDNLKSEMHENIAESEGDFDEQQMDDVLDVLFHRTEAGKDYSPLN